LPRDDAGEKEEEIVFILMAMKAASKLDRDATTRRLRKLVKRKRK
jgi:hypothetical protein